MKPAVIPGIVVVIVIIGGGIAYAYSNPTLSVQLGLRHAPAQTTASSTPSQRFAGARGGFATGTIEALNGDDFTITLSGGTTKDIDLTATTTIENYASASSTPTTITSDQLSVGEQVFVTGAPNADGSITATRVLTGTLPARPAGGRGGYGTRGGQEGSGSGGPQPTAPTPD